MRSFALAALGAVLTQAETVSIAACKDTPTIYLQQWQNKSLWSPSAPTANSTVVVKACSGTPAPLELELRLSNGKSFPAQSVAGLVVEKGAAVTLHGLLVVGSADIQGTLVLEPGELDTSNPEVENTDVFKADAKARSMDLRDCAWMPQGFLPRICSSGDVTVRSGGKLAVLPASEGFTYGSIYAPVTIEAGGEMWMNASAHSWNVITNYGTLHTAGGSMMGSVPTVIQGGVVNKKGGLISVEGPTRFDEWSSTLTPENVTVDTIVNEAGSELRVTGSLLGTYAWTWNGTDHGEHVKYYGRLTNQAGAKVSFAQGHGCGVGPPECDKGGVVHQWYIQNSGEAVMGGVYDSYVVNQGDLRLAGSSELQKLDNQGRLTLKGGSHSVSGGLRSSGSLTIADAAVSGGVHSSGDLSVEGSVSVSGGVKNSGRARVAKGASVVVSGGLHNGVGGSMKATSAVLQTDINNEGALELTQVSSQSVQNGKGATAALVETALTRLINDGKVEAVKAELTEVLNNGALELLQSTTDGDVVNTGRMTVDGGELRRRVGNTASALLRVIGKAAAWEGELRNAGEVAVDATSLFLRSHQSTGGTVRLTRGAQLAYHLRSDVGSHGYTYEERFGVPLGAEKAADAGSVCRAAGGLFRSCAGVAEIGVRQDADYHFSGSRVTGDRSGSLVFMGPLHLDGPSALTVQNAKVFTVAELGRNPFAGGGEFVVGKGAELAVGIDATLGGGGATRVVDGGRLSVAAHSSLALSNHTLRIGRGGAAAVDGTITADKFAVVSNCGTITGAGNKPSGLSHCSK